MSTGKKRKKMAKEVELEEEVLEEAPAEVEQKVKKEKKKEKKQKQAKEEADAVEEQVEEEEAAEPPAKKQKKQKKEEAGKEQQKQEQEQEEEATGADGLVSAEAFRKKFHIFSAREGQELPDPVQRFEDAPFSKKIRGALVAAGFSAPSAIQAQGWPVAVQGLDLVAVAKTGSGKTIGFLLPAFKAIAKAGLDDSKGQTAKPFALVLAPTRELASQIDAECQKFASFAKITSLAVFGGVPKGPQAKACRDKPQVLIATPGRLQDLMEMGAVSLKEVQFLVLDEADRMLDMGFEPEIAKILGATPSERQTLLFTATWPKAVQQIASKYLKENHVHVNVGETEELAANKAVTQEFFKIGDDEKEVKLWRIIADMPEEGKLIAFMNTKRRVVSLQKAFWDRGFEVSALHGDKKQAERDQDLANFASGKSWLLFATDVCARGLDIRGVTHVVNYDMARDVESYVHRIGRTGRAGAKGKSITFWNEDYDMDCAPALTKVAREAGQEVPDWLQKAADKQKEAKNKLWRY